MRWSPDVHNFVTPSFQETASHQSRENKMHAQVGLSPSINQFCATGKVGRVSGEGAEEDGRMNWTYSAKFGFQPLDNHTSGTSRARFLNQAALPGT